MKLPGVGLILTCLMLGAGSNHPEAHTRQQCLNSPDVIGEPEVPPVPLGINRIPSYNPVFLDAGIGDTARVRFVVLPDGTIDPRTYCVEQAPIYTHALETELVEWRFEPARHGGAVVPATYRLEVVFTPDDTVRGPIGGARTLEEVYQPLLQVEHPRLTVGPTRRSHGLTPLASVGSLDDATRNTLTNSLIEMAGLEDVPVVCLRIGDRQYLQWDRDAEAPIRPVQSECGPSGTLHWGEVLLDTRNTAEGRYEGGLIVIHPRVRTHEDWRCTDRNTLCGGGRFIQFECELQADDPASTAVCIVTVRSHWLV